MRETLQNLNELTLHKKAFHSIKEKLNLCYESYTNKQTIIDLLEFWIFSIKALYIAYGSETVKMFLRGNSKDIFKNHRCDITLVRVFERVIRTQLFTVLFNSKLNIDTNLYTYEYESCVE